MPYQTPLNGCSTLSVVMVAHFGRQLLEVVQFLHGQNIAHHDLKPENVVVDLHTAQLFIIDYNLAMFVDGQNEVVHGYVGMNGFTAPVLRLEYFSDIPRTSGQTLDVQLRAIDATLCIIGHLAPNLGECPNVFLFVTTQIFL